MLNATQFLQMHHFRSFVTTHEDRVLCSAAEKNQSHEIFGITLIRSGEILSNLEDLCIPESIQGTTKVAVCTKPV